MHFVLTLILITAQGAQPQSFDMPSLEACVSAFNKMMAKVEPDKMREAGYVGYGGGCIVTFDPSSDASKS